MHAQTILLSEKEPVIAFDLRNLLEKHHFRVLEADHPASIEAMCREFRPDLAIINFRQVDDSDGMGLAAALRRHFNLPVLCITGARAQDIRASRHFDASLPVLHKPFTSRQFLQVVQHWLGAIA